MGEVKPKHLKREVEKSKGAVDMRKTRINRSRTLGGKSKEKEER
jgi:hypothetical protein